MSSPSDSAQSGFRGRLRRQVERLRRRSSDLLRSGPTVSRGRTIASHDDGLPTSTVHVDLRGSTIISSQTHSEPGAINAGSHGTTSDTDTDAAICNHGPEGTVLISSPGASTTHQPFEVDIWSAAFKEAVDALHSDVDIAILQGKSIERLFKELEGKEQDATQESRFLRGVQYLRSVKVPLENFKMALDLATPLTRLEPTVTTVFGVVASVTAVAISLASADHDFAKQVGEMLEQISYIDDCDTLGRKAHKNDIHKALVAVYKNIVQFHAVAYDILTRKGMRLLIKMVLEKDRLPDIVVEFLAHAGTLQKLIQKATLEIALDIKNMLCEERISGWLGSDKSARQSQYLAELREYRADRACDFLLSNPDFKNWMSPNGASQLAILGDMGCGKTVVMTFIHDELIRRNRQHLPQPKVCSCYCRNDETGRGSHILCTLILALLEQLPGLQRTFYDWYKREQASGNISPEGDTRKLGSFLETVLISLDRPLFVLVDGLDECERSSRDYLLDLLDSITRKTPRVKTLVSSRPETEVLQRLEAVAKIELLPDIKRDTIIVEHNVKHHLYHLSEDVRTLTVGKLSRLARGSAIWSRMVVQLLKIRGIQELGPMTRFLDNVPLPQELAQIYDSLFARCTSSDAENQHMLNTALKVLTVARRPLNILELAWAVTLAIHDNVSSVAALQDLVDPRRLVRLLHPFISKVDPTCLRVRQVRLVHQSLKEYVLGRRVPRIPGTMSSSSDTLVMRGNEVASTTALEAEILDLCIRYLLLDDVDRIYIFSEDQLALDALPQEVDLFVDDTDSAAYDPFCSWEDWEHHMVRYDPVDRGFGEFFVYSSCYWPDHFGSVDATSLPQLIRVETLCCAGSNRIHNWIEQNRRPGCTIKARFLFEAVLYDPLSVTSLYGTQSMLEHMMKQSDLKSDHFLPGTVLRAAEQVIQWGEPKRLKSLLINEEQEHQLQMSQLLELSIRAWPRLLTKYPEWNILSDFIVHVPDGVLQENGEYILSVASEVGCFPVVRYLQDMAS